ncbi:hypothetical protein BX616_007147 [Lobosporangium transversale]|nr:hypothetical protein BX616_007147 [Lobosporangium transversale]
MRLSTHILSVMGTPCKGPARLSLFSRPMLSLSCPISTAAFSRLYLPHDTTIVRAATIAGSSLAISLSGHCRSCMDLETRFRRGLMTDTRRKEEPLLKFSGNENKHVSPQEYKIRVGAGTKPIKLYISPLSLSVPHLLQGIRMIPIRTLREELPQFFQDGLCTTSIYASNIRLIEASHTNVSIQGKSVYFLLAGALRWSFKMWFRDLEVEILSIRVNDRGGRGLKGMDSGNDTNGSAMSSQSSISASASSSNILRSFEAETMFDTLDRSVHYFAKESPIDFTERYNPPSVVYADKLGKSVGPAGMEDSTGEESQPSPATTVTVRWTMKGTTRPSVVLTSAGPTLPPPSSYEGVFMYQFDDRGLIDEHRIENIMPSPSPEAIQRAFAWWGWLLSRTRPATAAVSEDADIRKRLGLGFVNNK